MAAVLNTNMASLYAQKSLVIAQTNLATSVQRLSSGLRVNSAKDDAAGLGIAESVKGIKAITDQSILNIKNAISQVQTAEGALDVVGKILQRVLALTTQRQDSSLNVDQKNLINHEIASLLNEVQNVKERTRFQGNQSSVFGVSNTISSGAGTTELINIPDLSLAQNVELQNTKLISLSGDKINILSIDETVLIMSISPDDYGEASNGQTINAGDQIYIDGEDTGLTVTSVSYPFTTSLFMSDTVNIFVTGNIDSVPAFQLSETLDRSSITFSGINKSSYAPITPINIDESIPIILDEPITNLTRGNILVNQSGVYIGTVDSVSGESVELDDPPYINVFAGNEYIQVMTGKTQLDLDSIIGNIPGNYSFNLADGLQRDPYLSVGSIITNYFGFYLGTVTEVNNNTIFVTNTNNWINTVFGTNDASMFWIYFSEYFSDVVDASREVPITPPGGFLFSSPLSRRVSGGLGLVDIPGADTLFSGKISSSAYYDDSGNIQHLIANDVANLSEAALADAIHKNSTNRASLGAWINRLDFAIDNMQTLSNNLSDGISRIVDTDYANETANLTRGQILQQAATSTLAQANQMPNVILMLMK